MSAKGLAGMLACYNYVKKIDLCSTIYKFHKSKYLPVLNTMIYYSTELAIINSYALFSDDYVANCVQQYVIVWPLKVVHQLASYDIKFIVQLIASSTV